MVFCCPARIVVSTVAALFVLCSCAIPTASAPPGGMSAGSSVTSVFVVVTATPLPPTPSSTPNVDATIAARVQATIAARPTETSIPTPVATFTPAPTATTTMAPTATPVPVATSAPARMASANTPTPPVPGPWGQCTVYTDNILYKALVGFQGPGAVSVCQAATDHLNASEVATPSPSSSALTKEGCAALGALAGSSLIGGALCSLAVHSASHPLWRYVDGTPNANLPLVCSGTLGTLGYIVRDTGAQDHGRQWCQSFVDQSAASPAPATAPKPTIAITKTGPALFHVLAAGFLPNEPLTENLTASSGVCKRLDGSPCVYHFSADSRGDFDHDADFTGVASGQYWYSIHGDQSARFAPTTPIVIQ